MAQSKMRWRFRVDSMMDFPSLLNACMALTKRQTAIILEKGHALLGYLNNF